MGQVDVLRAHSQGVNGVELGLATGDVQCMTRRISDKGRTRRWQSSAGAQGAACQLRGATHAAVRAATSQGSSVGPARVVVTATVRMRLAQERARWRTSSSAQPRSSGGRGQRALVGEQQRCRRPWRATQRPRVHKRCGAGSPRGSARWLTSSSGDRAEAMPGAVHAF